MLVMNGLRSACATALLALLLCGCNPGGGNPGGSGPFEVSTGPGGGKIGGLNVAVTLTFNKSVDPGTVGAASIQVVTVADPAGLATAPAGSQASISFTISGPTVKLVPSVQFTPSGVQYGFLANALYEIAFTPPGGGTAVTSFAGQALSNAGTTFFFRTPLAGFDFNPGFPHARAFLVDDADGVVLPGAVTDANADGDLVDDTIAFYGNPVEVLPAVPAQEVPVAPVRDILFVFADAIAPATAVSTVDGSSPAMRVSVNTAPVPELLPKTVPGDYAIRHQQGNLSVVRWRAQFVAWPPGGFLFVQVNGLVEDIAGNSKASVTGTGQDDLFALLHVADGADATAYHILEPFDDSSKEDVANTSAAWASTFPGQLGPVLGGGTGKDGAFFIDITGTQANPGLTQIPQVATVDFTTRSVALPVVQDADGGLRVPRTWDFTTFLLPANWTLRILTDRNADGTLDPEEFVVQDPGSALDGLAAPLSVRCSGDLQLHGTVDVDGVDAPTLVRPESAGDPLYAAYRGQGGAGATSILAAGGGAAGGDVLMLKQDTGIAASLKSPLADPAFQSSDGKLVGATGRSQSLTPTTLFDPDTDLTAVVTDPGLQAAIAAGDIRLQPNLGVGSSAFGNSGTANESIDENHPTFVVQDISVTAGHTTITVTSQPGDPTLNQASKNIGALPIAAASDCYLLGHLHGRSGDDLLPVQRGGIGAEPYVVVNEGALGISTTGGGGGGGGSIAPGADGESDGPASNPLVNQRGGSGGLALDDSPGGPGGAGAVTGTGRAMGGTEFDLVSQAGGRPLAELAGSALVGSFLVPNAGADGWMFRIASFDGLTFVIERIQLDVIDIGLLEGPGVDGPGLVVGNDYPFLIVPSLEIGGAGGGGSGVSVTGTTNSAFTILPVLAPGAGGGAGGGSVHLETARDMLLGPACRILARGGSGGRVTDLQTRFAGGGGGGGGNAVLRVGRVLNAFQGALVSVAGGEGGSQSGFGRGGAGGGGFIRFEQFEDALDPATLQAITEPPITGTNVGRLLGLPQGIGQSSFYPAVVVNPEYEELTVTYVADTDGDHVPEDHSWGFTDTGADGGAGALLDPPFRIAFDAVGTNENGFLDTSAVGTSFFKASDLVSARTGLAWDATGGVLLYCAGRRATQVHRLDPATLAPVTTGPTKILLPVIPSVGEQDLDVLSLAVDASGGEQEVFLLERATRRVHVIDLATAAFLRTITLPTDLAGAMTYDPGLDVLVFARNDRATLVTFAPRDAAAATPATADYEPVVPVAEYAITRDGAPLETEITGLALDASGPSLWCLDAMAGTVFQVSWSPGSEGSSVTGLQRFSRLTAGGLGVVPSSLAFDGSSLFLLHATDAADARLAALAPSAVSLGGAPLPLATFGTLLPEGARALADGASFLRFRIVIDGVHDDGVTQFGTVRIDGIDLRYENRSF